MMALTTNQMILIEQRVTNDAKSTGTAYLLWFFLGLLSGHRFYLGRPVSAILQVLSYFIVIGFVWWVVDAFLISGMIQEDKQKIRSRLMSDMSIAAAGAEVA
jgi:TM2 domain-containing membrane protein YozV